VTTETCNRFELLQWQEEDAPTSTFLLALGLDSSYFRGVSRQERSDDFIQLLQDFQDGQIGGLEQELSSVL